MRTKALDICGLFGAHGASYGMSASGFARVECANSAGDFHV